MRKGMIPRMIDANQKRIDQLIKCQTFSPFLLYLYIDIVAQYIGG